MNTELLAQMRLAALELAAKTCYPGSSEDVLTAASRYESFILNGTPPREPRPDTHAFTPQTL